MSHPLFPASHSKLSLYERCALQAKLRYIDKIETPKGEAASRGTDLHASIEGFLKGEKNSLPRVAVHLAPIALAVREAVPFIEHKIALDRSLSKEVGWRDPTAHFRMVMDAAYVKDGTAHVQEWKSGKEYDEHLDQRKTYAMGAITAWNVDKVEVVTHYIDLKIKKTLQADPAKRTLWAWHLTQRLETMENDKHFAPRPGRYCNWCPFSRKKGGQCRVG